MLKATISGDIIGFTSLNRAGKIEVENALSQLFIDLNSQFSVYSRLVKGDNVECFLYHPQNALRVALSIKSYLKYIAGKLKAYAENETRYKLFKVYGIRLAIGIGEMERFEPKSMVFDGEAIYLSGRSISGNTTNNRKRPTVKETLVFVSTYEEWNRRFGALLALLEEAVNKATTRQCEVLYHRLRGLSETEVAAEMKISQPAVNTQSAAIGWNAIETALVYYEKTFENV